MAFGILVDVGKSNTKFESELISIDLDVVQEEMHEWTNEVTQFPVETGSPITDHIQPMPDRLTISGVMTNSAIGKEALDQLNGGDDRVQDAFDALLKLKEDRELMTVYTRLKIYEDMAIKSCSLPRDASIGDSIKFKMEFMHVRLVDTQTVDVPNGISKKLDKKADKSLQNKTQPPKDGGKKDPITVNKPDTGKSLAKVKAEQAAEKLAEIFYGKPK